MWLEVKRFRWERVKRPFSLQVRSDWGGAPSLSWFSQLSAVHCLARDNFDPVTGQLLCWGLAGILSSGISERHRPLWLASCGQKLHTTHFVSEEQSGGLAPFCRSQSGRGWEFMRWRGTTLKKGALVCGLAIAQWYAWGGGEGWARPEGQQPWGWIGKEKYPRNRGQKSFWEGERKLSRPPCSLQVCSHRAEPWPCPRVREEREHQGPCLHLPAAPIPPREQKQRGRDSITSRSNHGSQYSRSSNISTKAERCSFPSC